MSSPRAETTRRPQGYPEQRHRPCSSKCNNTKSTFVPSHPSLPVYPWATMADAQEPPRSEPEPRDIHFAQSPWYRSATVWDFLSNLLGLIFTAAVITVVGRCISNVFGPAGDIMALADEAACLGEPPGCTTRISYLERHPWGHFYNLTTPGASKSIWCQRASYIFGDWSCTTTSSIVDPMAMAPRPPVTIYVPLPAGPAPVKQAPASSAPRPTPSAAASP